VQCVDARLTAVDYNNINDARKGVASNRSFGLVCAFFFVVVAIAPFFFGGETRGWAWAWAGGFLALSLSRPSLLLPLNWLWMRVGLLMGHITNFLVLGVIFFSVVTPMGHILRLLGKRPLSLRWMPQAQSYWVQRSPYLSNFQHMKRQF